MRVHVYHVLVEIKILIIIEVFIIIIIFLKRVLTHRGHCLEKWKAVRFSLRQWKSNPIPWIKSPSLASRNLPLKYH